MKDVNKRKIAIVTGARSDFGILHWLIKEMEKSQFLKCQLVVTGSHLAISQGRTIDNILEEGFRIDGTVPMLLDGDTPEFIGHSVGHGIIGMVQEFSRLRPDMVLLLGDRFEIFAAASAAMSMQIPIVHLAGGETDIANCIDGNIRNAITKMSHLHFVSHELYEQRVLQMGEERWRVHNVGLPSLDNIDKNLLEKSELESFIGFEFTSPIFLITYLPVVLHLKKSIEELQELLEALKHFPEAKIVFTLANADAGGREINDIIRGFTRSSKNAVAFTSLGKRRYLSMLHYSDVVIGNSSSGIIEAASFHKPVINIGERQAGRVHPGNVIDVNGKNNEIISSIEIALYDEDFKNRLKHLVNPFGDGRASKKIVKVLENITLDKKFIEKKLEAFNYGK